MGSIFWLTILYSLVGYIGFLLLSTLVSAYIKNNDGKINHSKALASLTLFVLLVSGPLSWGMVIRNTLRLKEES